jgi:hypothetical protein
LLKLIWGRSIEKCIIWRKRILVKQIMASRSRTVAELSLVNKDGEDMTMKTKMIVQTSVDNNQTKVSQTHNPSNI